MNHTFSTRFGPILDVSILFLSACFEMDTRYYTFGSPKATLEVGPANQSPEECQAACQDNADCRNFAFRPSPPATCYLHGENIMIRSDDGWVSGPKYCPLQ